MTVTATEFKVNFGKYLDMIENQDIYITRNGKTIAKVINPQVSAVDSLKGLLSNVPETVTMKDIKNERLNHHESND